MTEALPVDFVAFHAQQHRAYLRYAHLHLDSREATEEVVEDVFTDLAVNWQEVLRQPSVEAYALAALKESIARHLAAHQRDRALVESAAFAAAREATRERLKRLESRLGLYSAIAQLPERQLDVVVLRFVLGYPLQKVAHLMGVSEGTVRSHTHGARRRLARELGIDWEECV